MHRSVELTESVYQQLVRAAEASGTTPAGWIQDQLPKNGSPGAQRDPTDAELAAADAALDECLVSPVHPLGTDNEQMDADLAHEYGDDHAGLYRPTDIR